MLPLLLPLLAQLCSALSPKPAGMPFAIVGNRLAPYNYTRAEWEESQPANESLAKFRSQQTYGEMWKPTPWRRGRIYIHIGSQYYTKEGQQRIRDDIAQFNSQSCVPVDYGCQHYQPCIWVRPSWNDRREEYSRPRQIFSVVVTPGMPSDDRNYDYNIRKSDVEKFGFLRHLAFFAGLPAEHNQYQRDKYITLTPSRDSDMEVFRKDQKNYFSLITEEYDYESATHISEDLAWELAKVRIASKDPNRPVPKTMKRRLSKDQKNYFSLITEEYDYESATHISEDLAWELAKVRIASKDPNRPVPKTMKRRLSKLDVFKIAHLHNCSGLQDLTFNTTSTTSVDSSSKEQLGVDTTSTTTTSIYKFPSTTSVDSSSQVQLGVDTTSTTTSKYKFTFEIDGFDGANNGGDYEGDNNGGDFDYSFSGTTTTSSAAIKTTTTRNGTVLFGNLDAQ
ncbi:uncharacterized protein LOC108675597, partial [Hyalella azteca]|uniref:Uncharacterized protein LOC108675597 n=1 Tax=Hyalella azteca TaxID=294128 RepID=A0A8B7NZD6_HYAAZ